MKNNQIMMKNYLNKQCTRDKTDHTIWGKFQNHLAESTKMLNFAAVFL